MAGDFLASVSEAPPSIQTSSETSAPRHLDWSLRTCCERGQWITFGIVLGGLVISILLWHIRIGRFEVLLPFKMLSVFLHEFGHASAAWMTCGRVHGIEVHSNGGGVTKTTGGNMYVILPAGYLGSCFWGVFFLLMGSINIWTLRIASGLLCFFLLIVLVFFARNWSLRLICIFFLLLLLGMWVWTEMMKIPWPLRVIVLFLGVINAMYGVWDIWDDTIRRKVPESDSYKYAKLTHCNSRFCGVLWACLAFAFIIITLYLLFVIKDVGNESF